MLKQGKKQDKYFVEKQEIREIFEMNKACYGSRRILAILRQKGYIINHKTVLCQGKATVWTTVVWKIFSED